jgi:predicted transcriptional regulator
MQKRSKDQIIANILDICRDGANKTKIVYQVNLNFRTITPPLDLLLRKGFLVASQGDRPIYRTTPQGERAIVTLQEARAIYS